MLSQCANPQCSRPFLRLRQGKLFLMETDGLTQSGKLRSQASSRMQLQQRVERYWLCDQCAEVWTLMHDRTQGIVLMPLRRTAASAGATMAQDCRESA
jgi:hypothetical protein